MSTSLLIEGKRGPVIGNMRFLEPGPDYTRLIVDSLAESGGVSSLVCNGGIPACIDATAEPRDDILGRDLIKSYVVDAFNAACDHYGDNLRQIEHCMYKTAGDSGFVMDHADRVWPENSAGAYMTLIVNSASRKSVLGTTDQILSEEMEGSIRPVQKAFLDALLLPLAQKCLDSELPCETMMYISTTCDELKKYMTPDDFAVVKSGLSKVEGCTDSIDESKDARLTQFTANLLGSLSAVVGLPTPVYMSPSGQSHRFAEIMCMADTAAEDFYMKHCLKYKLWIDTVNDRERSGLLIAAFLDIYQEWGGGHTVLDDFAGELVENEWAFPQPMDIYNVEHRAVTEEHVLGVSSVTEVINVQGGRLMPAEFGEITTKDFSGRKVGTVDKRRTVVYFDDNENLVVQFKNIRNYFLNILYFARPGKFVQTEVREAVVDRDKLVGLPALHMLLRGRTNLALARFIIAALTFGAVSIKKRRDKGVGEMLGVRDGKHDFRGIASPSVLAAFPTVIDSEQQLYLYHDGATYRARCTGLYWHVEREDMRLSPIGFGTLASAFPMKGWSRD